jgi:cyclic pyranopterin phosphate synthase
MAEKNSTPASFTHFDASGNARMVDVSAKEPTNRVAIAEGSITVSPKAFEMIKSGSMAKGDVLGVARIAGIMAAKNVDNLIPLTHPLNITKADVNFDFDNATNTIAITSEVGITGKTGVEMEALTAVSVAALTIYDMCKAVDKKMIIGNIHLLSKTGGKSGSYKYKS